MKPLQLHLKKEIKILFNNSSVLKNQPFGYKNFISIKMDIQFTGVKKNLSSMRPLYDRSE